MKQYYSNLFCSKPVLYQSFPDPEIFPGGVEDPKEFEAFWKDYMRVITNVKDPVVPKDPKRNTRIYDIRKWEVWAVLNNALIEPHHRVLEYGSWPTFYCVYVSTLVKEMIAIDNFQGLGRNDGPYWAAYTTMFADVWLSEMVKYNRPNLHVFQADIQLTNFVDKSFDRVVSYGVHEHVKDDLKGLREVHRILKDDGLASMTVDFFEHGWEYHGPTQGRCYDSRTLTALVEGAGFEFICLPEWDKYEVYKDRINTVEHPEVYALAVVLRKRGV